MKYDVIVGGAGPAGKGGGRPMHPLPLAEPEHRGHRPQPEPMERMQNHPPGSGGWSSGPPALRRRCGVP